MKVVKVGLNEHSQQISHKDWCNTVIHSHSTFVAQSTSVHPEHITVIVKFPFSGCGAIPSAVNAACVCTTFAFVYVSQHAFVLVLFLFLHLSSHWFVFTLCSPIFYQLFISLCTYGVPSLTACYRPIEIIIKHQLNQAFKNKETIKRCNGYSLKVDLSKVHIFQYRT